MTIVRAIHLVMSNPFNTYDSLALGELTFSRCISRLHNEREASEASKSYAAQCTVWPRYQWLCRPAVGRPCQPFGSAVNRRVGERSKVLLVQLYWPCGEHSDRLSIRDDDIGSYQRRENGQAEMNILQNAIRSVRDSGEVWSRYIQAIVSLHSTETLTVSMAQISVGTIRRWVRDWIGR